MTDRISRDELDEARKIIAAGNESYTDGDILRQLAQKGLRIAKLTDRDVEYMQEIQRTP